MIKKKVCLVGDFAVGKTSLARRFVKNEFSDKYLSTVGVKIDTKEVEIRDGERIKLVVWDIAGRDSVSPVNLTYLTGAAGYFLVADGTRADTLSSIRGINELIVDRIGATPFICLINKSDDTENWRFKAHHMEQLDNLGWQVLLTSAKTGDNVETAFLRLADMLLEAP